jgi:hypothetical protein
MSRPKPSNRLSRRRSAVLVGMAVVLLGLDGAVAQELGELTRVSGGQSPFADCQADQVAQQSGTNYPNTEIEPYVVGNPTAARNLLAGWQQDRWDNGGARSDVAGVSKDGGATWRTVIIPGITLCSGGEFQRASDPWVDFSPNGVAYFMSLSFDEDLPTGGFGRNAMLVNRSTDGGLSWSRPVTLIEDTSPQVLNDKNSLTADPTNPDFVYAVWDRIVDFTIPPAGGNAGVTASSAMVKAEAGGGDGVVAARQRVRQLRRLAASRAVASQAAQVFFEGPAYFARTTDGGRSWERAREIYDPGANAQTINNIIVVPPNGTVIDLFTEISPEGSARLGLLRSFNKGRTFERRPTYATDIAFSFTGTITPDAQEPVRDAAILFDPGVDPRNGNLYAVFQDTRFSGVDEVAFVMSTDNGRRWSAPVRINQTPRNANALRQQAFVPSIEVGPGGVLVVTYYDFRNDDAPAELTDHWAVFCDPGRRDCAQAASWGEERRLTRRSFDMLLAPVAGGHFLGDYMGLAQAGGAVHPVFGIATGPDLTDLFTRRIGLRDVAATVAP